MAIVNDPDTALPGWDLQALIDGPVLFWDHVARMQRMQVEMLVSLEQSLARSHRDLWDEWACRWAGGAPFDR